MEHRPIVIAGAGPGGAATALALHRLDPHLAREIVVLEKARHPRPKVCAGGLIPAGRNWIERHGIPFHLPHVVVDRVRAATPRAVVDHSERNFCYIVRRNELDSMLVDACRQRGIEVREQEPVRRLYRESGAVRIETDQETYTARIVVGADGSGSLVRRTLVSDSRATMARATMCDIRLGGARDRQNNRHDGSWDGHQQHRSDFDFTDVPRGLAGYRWSFPCIVDGVPHINVGVYSMGRAARLMQSALEAEMARHGVSDARRASFPIHWYRRHQTKVAADNTLLVGDAAGADPLMGEGISLALEYGSIAAGAAVAALRTGDLSGRAYQTDIDDSWLGIKLGRLGALASRIYGHGSRACFAVPERSPRLRALGLRWYNGIDDWDRRSLAEAAWSICQPGFTQGGSVGDRD